MQPVPDTERRSPSAAATTVAACIEAVAAAMTPARRRRFSEQLLGLPADRPVVPSGLAPFLLVPPPEARTLTRARLAALLQALVAGNGHVTRDELLSAGFSPREIDNHFRAASRIAGLARMTA